MGVFAHRAPKILLHLPVFPLVVDRQGLEVATDGMDQALSRLGGEELGGEPLAMTVTCRQLDVVAIVIDAAALCLGNALRSGRFH